MTTGSTVLVTGVIVVVVGSLAYAWAVQRDARDAANAAQQPPTSGLAGSSAQGAALGQSIVTTLGQVAIAGAHVVETISAQRSTSSGSGSDIHTASGSSSPH